MQMQSEKINDVLFINGLNLAWIEFGRDVGVDPNDPNKEYHPDISKFEEAMNFANKHGANVVRWWYHTNGSTNPVFDKNQMVGQNPDFFHKDVKTILDLAQSKNLRIQICLWSFDMLKKQWGVNVEANKKILIQEKYTKAYIDNALIPLVTFIGNHPALFAWEIFNEPEGMTNKYAKHWPDFKDRVEMSDIQRFINKTAGAIRRAQTNVKITNGALGFLTNVNDPKNGYYNAYSDVNLINQGNDDMGYLDFYNIHYYKWARSKGSPFHSVYNPKLIDKPAIIGEYYPDDLSFDYKSGDMDHKLPFFSASNLGTALIKNQWAGSIVWSWTDRNSDEEKERMAAIMTRVSKNLLHIDGVSSNKKDNAIKIYPNPAKDKVHVKGLMLGDKIGIYDFSGNIVKKVIAQHDIEIIWIENLQIGYYSVVIEGRKQLKMYKK